MTTLIRTFKIRRGQVTHCVTAGALGEYRDMPFALLESIVRGRFQIPASSNFTINYTSLNNDEVTIYHDADIYHACVVQDLNPVHLTVWLQGEESWSSAHDARPPNLAILLKLDQLLLAVNKLLAKPVVAPRGPKSTKKDHFVVVDDSPVDDSTLKKMEERFLVVGESSIAGPTIEHAKDAAPSKERTCANAQSGSGPEFLRRATTLQQRLLTEEVSDVMGRGAESTEVFGSGSESVAGPSTIAPNLEGPLGVGKKKGCGARKKKTGKHR